MRTLLVRSLQSVIAFATVALLTGANDAGCGLGTVINGGTGGGQSTTGTGTIPVDPPPPIACPAGMVVQLVCDPASPSGGGVIGVNECTGPNCPPPPPPCDPSDPSCVPPNPGDAGTPPDCDPSDPSCVPPNPGDAGPPPQCDPADPDCASPPPPPPQCDPADPNCPPSFPPPGCAFQCVPENQGCPPGTDAVTICSNAGTGEGDSGTGGQSGDVPPSDPNTPVSTETCWLECAPHGCGGGSGGGETPSEPPIPD
jgi:hypothetical protein